MEEEEELTLYERYIKQSPPWMISAVLQMLRHWAKTGTSPWAGGFDAVKYDGSILKAIKAAGGEVIGSVRMPIANPDFSAFVQRAKDLNPESIFIFIPGGAQPAALGKAFAERAIDPKKVKLLSTGEPVASRVQSRVLKRLSPVCAPLKVVESSQSSARSTFTQNTLLLATAACVVASLLMHASTVGGSAVAEHTAVAVMP